jgi:hypothetical protein
LGIGSPGLLLARTQMENVSSECRDPGCVETFSSSIR